jgi:hypothetical protein
MNRQSKGLSKGPETEAVQKSCFFLDLQMPLLKNTSRGFSAARIFYSSAYGPVMMTVKGEDQVPQLPMASFARTRQ